MLLIMSVQDTMWVCIATSIVNFKVSIGYETEKALQYHIDMMVISVSIGLSVSVVSIL